MSDLRLRTFDGADIAVSAAALAKFGEHFRGTLIMPESKDYDGARAIWNAMIDRRPGMIARCANAEDVAAAVGFARAHKLLVAVRGGGHNIAGNAMCDGGVVIDLSQMKAIKVDANGKRARVEPGATLADVDRETQKFGLAVPTGINSTTGIAGLTLGGGFGWISRKFGLTVDNLVGAEVVTADGTLVYANAEEHPDLFWALRGGGGNFGVVTAFEFALHDVGPEVVAGLVVHPLADAVHVLKEFRRVVAELPDDVTCWFVMRKAPPLPFIPAEWHGREVCILAMCSIAKDGEKALAPLRAIGKPIAEHVGAMPFTAWQAMFDPLLTPGARNYWKSHDLVTLPDQAIQTIVHAIEKLPGPECEVFTAHVGGAAGRVPVDATAFPQRATHFVMNVHTRWREAAQDNSCVTWARDLFNAMKPYASGTAYVNFMPNDEGDRVESAYGPNYRRLAQIKRRYDPDNFFRMNQNVRPAA